MRPNININMDLEIKSKCRTCLHKQPNMISLFESQSSVSLRDKIMCFAKVSVTEDGGPTHMCNLCFKELGAALNFREKCEVSDKKIRSILQQIQGKNDIPNGSSSEFLDTSCAQTLNAIKEESNNENSCDFFDSSLDFTIEILDDLKIEYETEEHENLSKSLKHSQIQKSAPLENNLKNNYAQNVAEYENSILPRKSKRKKLRHGDAERPTKNPKKRGRKPKLLKNIEYDCKIEGDLMKVLNKDLKCSICKKSFPDTKTLKNHIKVHSKTRDHTCDQCGKQFKYRDNLKVHVMTHTGEKPFQCDLCDKSFSKKDNLAIHRKRHLKERNYSCDQCGSAYYTSYELKTHMRVHTGEKPHVCTLCGKRFTAKNNLYIHQRSHTGEKPHICSVCGKQFTSKNILSIHSRIHTGEKPYICSVCGKRFTANKLAVHMRTHTGEKPHVCPLCGKQFSATNVLVIHMRRHTGEKPYKCKMCGQTYGHTQSLNKHMRKQHKIVTNANQMHMQQINEAHQARLEGKSITNTPPKESLLVSDNSSRSPSKKVTLQPSTEHFVDRTNEPNQPIDNLPPATEHIQSSISQELLKIT